MNETGINARYNEMYNPDLSVGADITLIMAHMR